MLICVIEFGTLPGMDERRRQLVAEMLVEARTIDGFISKESFQSLDEPGKVITLSYWRDAEALRLWMRHPEHRKVIPVGRNELFSHYTIQLAEITSEKVWKKPEPLP